VRAVIKLGANFGFHKRRSILLRPQSDYKISKEDVAPWSKLSVLFLVLTPRAFNVYCFHALLSSETENAASTNIQAPAEKLLSA
jgi:hypothetical protein